MSETLPAAELIAQMRSTSAKVKVLLESPEEFPMTDRERAEFEEALTNLNFILGMIDIGVYWE